MEIVEKSDNLFKFLIKDINEKVLKKGIEEIMFS